MSKFKCIWACGRAADRCFAYEWWTERTGVIRLAARLCRAGRGGCWALGGAELRDDCAGRLGLFLSDHVWGGGGGVGAVNARWLDAGHL